MPSPWCIDVDYQPIDPERLPDRLAEAIEKQCGDRSMLIVDGRPHYPPADVLKAIISAIESAGV